MVNYNQSKGTNTSNPEDIVLDTDNVLRMAVSRVKAKALKRQTFWESIPKQKTEKKIAFWALIQQAFGVNRQK